MKIRKITVAKLVLVIVFVGYLAYNNFSVKSIAAAVAILLLFMKGCSWFWRCKRIERRNKRAVQHFFEMNGTVATEQTPASD